MKALIVLLVALSLSIWSASLGVLPVGEGVQDFALGIVGVVGLSVAAAFRALMAFLVPAAMVLRVLALPILVGGVIFLVFSALKNLQSKR